MASFLERNRRHMCGLLHFLVLSLSSLLSRVIHCIFTYLFTHSFIILLTDLFICPFFSFICLLILYIFSTWRTILDSGHWWWWFYCATSCPKPELPPEHLGTGSWEGLSGTQAHHTDLSGGQLGKWGIPWLSPCRWALSGHYVET